MGRPRKNTGPAGAPSTTLPPIAGTEPEPLEELHTDPPTLEEAADLYDFEEAKAEILETAAAAISGTLDEKEARSRESESIHAELASISAARSALEVRETELIQRLDVIVADHGGYDPRENDLAIREYLDRQTAERAERSALRQKIAASGITPELLDIRAEVDRRGRRRQVIPMNRGANGQ